MLIRTRMTLAALVPVLLAVVIAAGLLASRRSDARLEAQWRTSVRLLELMGELNEVARAYVLHDEARPRREFLALQEEAARLLGATTFEDPEQEKLARDIGRAVQDMRSLFLKLVRNRERSGPVSEGLRREAEDRLVGRILIRSGGASADTARLTGSIHESAARTREGIGAGLLVSLVGAAVLLSLGLFGMSRTISRSLRALQDGTERVGAGDLSWRIGTQDDDEVGQLARGFDRMTGGLQALTRSRDELTDQLRGLAAELTQAEQRERRRVAGILHDHIQQLLVGAQMQVDGFRRERDPERARALADGVTAILKETLDASRSLSVELSPPALQEAGLIGGLDWLVARMRDRHHFVVHLETDPRAEPAREETRFLLFECVRELLLNVVKHAGVRQARVTLERIPGQRARITVEDEGPGFEPGRLAARHAGNATFGLFSIQQRIAHIGGQTELDTAPGRGTRVVLTVPVGRFVTGRGDTRPQEAAPSEGAAIGGRFEPVLPRDETGPERRQEAGRGGMFVLLVHYLVPPEGVEAVRAAHRAFLAPLYQEGRLVVSGPRTDGTGGVLIARGQSREELLDLLANDPFVLQGVGRYDVVEFDPKMVAAGFETFL